MGEGEDEQAGSKNLVSLLLDLMPICCCRNRDSEVPNHSTSSCAQGSAAACVGKGSRALSS